MSDNIEEMGPIDWLLIEFSEPLTGAAAPPLLDLMFIRKLSDGSVQAIEISDLPADEAVHVDIFDGASTGILGDEDLASAGEALEVDTRAVLLVFENTWAAPFAIAVREAGGFLVDSGRIPTQSIVAALDELAALEAELAD